MKALTFRIGSTAFEIHALKEGEHFPEFGGSAQGLIVKGSPSFIVRETGPGGIHDAEYGTTCALFWRWLATCLQNGAKDFKGSK